MNSKLIISLILLSIISSNALASKFTLHWTGKVPTIDCVSNPVSNQFKFNQLGAKCKNELKIIEQKKRGTSQAKSMVFFNL